ncbi:MAG TPA: TusE/DsrC/DsvC family sulfur relay protein [Xanthomonadales bacterium]|nr:TusE/DsrC/DsvC family sulfur relay protein [Xanthomonadales bacterium]
MKQTELRLDDGTTLALDEKGYLLDAGSWTPRVAECMALLDGIVLTAEHWGILHIFREYFSRYEIEPPMRALVRQAKEQFGEAKGSSRYLYQLFPQGPGIQACRYAGLPRPLSCI